MLNFLQKYVTKEINKTNISSSCMNLNIAVLTIEQTSLQGYKVKCSKKQSNIVTLFDFIKSNKFPEGNHWEI